MISKYRNPCSYVVFKVLHLDEFQYQEFANYMIDLGYTYYDLKINRREIPGTIKIKA